MEKNGDPRREPQPDGGAASDPWGPGAGPHRGGRRGAGRPGPDGVPAGRRGRGGTVRRHLALTAVLLSAVAAGPMLGAGALAQSIRPRDHVHSDVVIESAGSRPLQRRTRAGATAAARSSGISTSSDNQILLEMRPEDTTPANLFDLDGRTLVFRRTAVAVTRVTSEAWNGRKPSATT